MNPVDFETEVENGGYPGIKQHYFLLLIRFIG